MSKLRVDFRIVRYVVFCLGLIGAACGASAHGSVDVEVGSAGEPNEVPVAQGGKDLTSGGGSVVVHDGGERAQGGASDAGHGGVSLGGAAGAGLAGASAGASAAGASEAGQPAGGVAGADGQAGAAGQDSGPLPWKVCEGGAVCGEDEVCVYDSDTHRICSKIADQFDRCDPYAPQSPEFLSGCDDQPIECRTPYRKCSWLSANASGKRCPTLGFDNQNVRWYCGPPAP